MRNQKTPAQRPRKAPSNQTGGTAWGKKLAAEFSRMVQAADMEKLILLNFLYIIAFYMVEKAAWLYRHCNGDSVVDRLMVLFMNFGLAYKSVLPSFHPFDLMVGLVGAAALKAVIYAKKFYEEAYHFLEKKFGSEYVVAAVMHADEINKAATSDLGKDVYHYHLHAVVIPVVDKDILWSKRCKDPALRGTVRETIHQVSHSKKWASNIPLKDEQGQPVLRSNGKPKYRPSYSILQDELVTHMQEHGFTNFQRGELGSTRENLTSLQYQIEKDKERLANIQERVEAAQTKYEAAWNVRKTESEIDDMGKKTITGKYTVSKEDYKQLTALAKEGITSRQEIHKLNEDISLYKKQYIDCKYELRDTQSAYAALRRRCEPFLQALKYFPQFAKGFAEKIADLLEHREAQQKKEREEAKRNPHRSSVRRQDDQDLER